MTRCVSPGHRTVTDAHRRRVKACTLQNEADALVAEAAADFPPSPDLPQRHNVVRLVQGVYFITGSMNFPRGWVRAVQSEISRAGALVPTAAVCRWIRSQCTCAAPWMDLVEGVVPEFVSDMVELAGIADPHS